MSVWLLGLEASGFRLASQLCGRLQAAFRLRPAYTGDIYIDNHTHSYRFCNIGHSSTETMGKLQRNILGS